jgi:hypothetical protein
MSDSPQVEEARLLVDSYGPSSLLVRLAQLASPACRIEPQLLRHLRLECVPEADVSVEQELWHSELVNSRGATISFRAPVARVLRQRLREWRGREPALVESAREVMSGLHADLSPLLVLEDQLAWAEIFDDNAAIRAGAQDLLRSLLAGRDGLDHWLGRAWTGLPDELKELPEGRQLAQVAAAKGATIDENRGAPAGEQVAHTLPLVQLPMKLHGLRLDVNAPAPEATHVLDVPRTQPRAVSVTWPGGSQQLVFGESEMRTVHVKPGVVVIRNLAGAEYELEASGQSATFEIEMVPAGRGTSLIIRYGTPSQLRHIVVDCGNRQTGKVLGERFALTEPQAQVEVLVLTHIDDDRIGGTAEFLESGDLAGRVRDVWFNGTRQLDLVKREML